MHLVLVIVGALSAYLGQVGGAGCPHWEYRCQEGDCIPWDRLWDGIEDCPKGDDEGGVANFVPNHCKHKITGFFTPEMFLPCPTGLGDDRVANKLCIMKGHLCKAHEVAFHCPHMADKSSDYCNRHYPCTESGRVPCNLKRPVLESLELSWPMSKCVPESFLCNGRNDCPDNAQDEQGCSDVCPVTDRCEAVTGNKRICIKKHKCDGKKDCADGADEKGCCPIGKTSCRDTDTEQCIPLPNICDGTVDCASGFDERGCNAKFCKSAEHKLGRPTFCDDRCLRVDMCDGIPECDDGTDENCHNSADCKSHGLTERSFFCDNKCKKVGPLCDGKSDCVDGEDERCNNTADCKSHGLSDRSFFCDNKCTKVGLCDGEPECEDREDENCKNDADCRSHSKKIQFFCDDKCVDGSNVCDGTEECPYGKDEEDCSEDKCKRLAESGVDRPFSCGSKCIEVSKVCDGNTVCPGREDENICSNSIKCKKLATDFGTGRQFSCGDRCIEVSKVCDGSPDCSEEDAADEKGCSSSRCKELDNEFRTGRPFSCGDRCIEVSKVCDGNPDCSSEEDERDCSNSKCEELHKEFQTGRPFLCNAKCKNMHHEMICDGHKDCKDDGADEADCTQQKCDYLVKRYPQLDVLGTTYFACDGYCKYATRCDGSDNCKDAADEKNCEKCSTGSIYCGPEDKRCVASHDLCTGKDEENALCKISKKDVRDCSAEFCKELAGREYFCQKENKCYQSDWQCDENCGMEKFYCTADDTCVASSKKCNGKSDCSDDEDELECSNLPCLKKCPHWKHKKEVCYDDYQCDGKSICGSHIDEMTSKCYGDTAKPWACKDGSNIENRKLCNGEKDCSGGEDEEGCDAEMLEERKKALKDELPLKGEAARVIPLCVPLLAAVACGSVV